MNLRDYLLEYKALTLDILEEIDGYGDIIFLSKKREEIIEKIKDAGFLKDEIRNITEELGIVELEYDLKSAVEKEKVKVKREIVNLKKRKSANMRYTSSTYSNVNTYSRFDKFN